MTAFTKQDLASTLKEQYNLDRTEANKFVNDFFDSIKNCLINGDAVKIAGFGNFTLRDKKERIGRNPKTKEECIISARRVVSFYASNMLKEKLNTEN
jgi:integration host factor subunit alpha